MRWLILLLAFSAFAHAEETELLPPEQAFRFSVRVTGPDEVIVNYDIAPGYYLYREKFQFEISPQSLALGKPELPAGKVHEDEFFGKVEIYRGELSFRLPLDRSKDAAQSAVLSVTSQGCADAGVCYVPSTEKATLLLPASNADATGAEPRSKVDSPPPAPAGGDESGRIASFLSGNFFLLGLGFFGIGLALAFTPCVFPMIPILSGIIAGQGSKLTRNRAFGLSAAYVLGMALTYALAGIAAGLSGAMLSAALQNAWVLGAFALIFVVLALSMFGFYELQMPAALQSKLSDASGRITGGFTGALIMGAFSAIIIGPCVTPALAGALLFISQSGDVARGGSALFAMALGMGAPLLAIGTSAGTLLPKAGPWMDAVKKFFGVLLLGVAIWLISPVIPAVAHMLLWAALLTMSAVYLRALDPLPNPAPGMAKFSKGVGVLALLAGVALLVGALSGGRDVLQPLSALRSGTREQASHLNFERVKNVAELDSRIAAATGRFVMLDFYADWCVACKEMERFTFSDPRVQASLRDVVLLQADVTANSAEDAALLKRFQLFGPPGIIFYDPRGREVTHRVIGYEPPQKFLQSLARVMQSGKAVQG
ncbi:MAG: protein-disulfide reductase DsbD [Burkholderiales bacterium]